MPVSPQNDTAEDVWAQTYKPIENPLVGPDERGFNNTMFETYGPEETEVFARDEQHVWTWVEGDDGNYIVNGRFRVNRLGYFITETPWPAPFAPGDISIQIEEYEEEENEDEVG